jgi:hypothetical protein
MRQCSVLVSITTLTIRTFSIATHSTMILRKMALWIMTVSITIVYIITLCISILSAMTVYRSQHNKTILNGI